MLARLREDYQLLFGRNWPVWLGGLLYGVINVLLFLHFQPWTTLDGVLNWGDNLFGRSGIGNAEALSPLLEEGYDHPIWQELGETCLGCGTCTLVCPSCYCFNVEDRLSLDLEGGERLRTWDSCQFDQFTRLSGGAEARADQADRQRHRFFRKYKYLWEKHHRVACVGCGRCGRE